MGDAIDENYRKLEWWTATATLHPDQPSVVYEKGDFVVHGGVIYKRSSGTPVRIERAPRELEGATGARRRRAASAPILPRGTRIALAAGGMSNLRNLRTRLRKPSRGASLGSLAKHARIALTHAGTRVAEEQGTSTSRGGAHSCSRPAPASRAC